MKSFLDTFFELFFRVDFINYISGSYSFIFYPILLLLAISLWRLFEKAGQNGWAALIPFYNIFIFLRIIGKPWWWFVLFFIPCLGFIWILWGWICMARRFGKSGLYGVAIVCLSFVFIPLLAFGKAEYQHIEQ